MMGRTGRVAVVLLAVLAAVGLAGCSSGGDASGGTGAGASSTTAQAAPRSSTTVAKTGAVAAGGGSGSCADLTNDDLATYLLNTQLLARIDSPEQVAALKTGALGVYEPETFAQILAKMHGALDGRPAPTFADPKDAITFFEELNAKVQAMFESPGPVSDQAIADYQKLAGGVEGVLGKQLPINAAIDAACKNLR